MPISFRCQKCHRSFEVPEALLGKTIRCSNCSEQGIVGGEGPREVVDAEVLDADIAEAKPAPRHGLAVRVRRVGLLGNTS